MHLELYFKNIKKGPNNIDPLIKIIMNNEEYHRCPVQNKILIKNNITDGNVKLEIDFYNKTNKDTVVNNVQEVISDMNFELDKIVIDNVDFENLKWQSFYESDKGKIEKCLFFGPKGKFVIEFEMPILKWFLKTQNQLRGDDPNWEEDYHYYLEACKILKQI